MFHNQAVEVDLTRIPHEFMCPISLEMMENPVITTAGLTYERACIEEWFRKGNSTDPMAHVPVMKIHGRSGRVLDRRDGRDDHRGTT